LKQKPQAGDPTQFRFSTDDLPERDRLAIWREVIGRTIAPLDLAPLGDGPFLSEASTRLLPELDVTAISISNVRSRRTRELTADGNDDILLVSIDQGGGVLSQRGREVTMEHGTGILLSNAEVSSVELRTPSRGRSLRMPRKALAPLLRNPDDAIMRPIPASNEALRLLGAYIAALDRMPELSAPTLRHLVSNHLHGLIAAAAGATGDALEAAQRRGLRAARLNAIKLDLARNIGRRDLSAEWAAERHGISPSYVRRLFESGGTTFSEFVLEARLTFAHGLLTDARHAARTISTIAYLAGFGDLSYFNRTFRRRFGASPSDLRAAARERD
jgi:AraC-like DNA-binding protein